MLHGSPRTISIFDSLSGGCGGVEDGLDLLHCSNQCMSGEGVICGGADVFDSSDRLTGFDSSCFDQQQLQHSPSIGIASYVDGGTDGCDSGFGAQDLLAAFDEGAVSLDDSNDGGDGSFCVGDCAVALVSSCEDLQWQECSDVFDIDDDSLHNDSGNIRSLGLDSSMQDLLSAFDGVAVNLGDCNDGGDVSFDVGDCAVALVSSSEDRQRQRGSDDLDIDDDGLHNDTGGIRPLDLDSSTNGNDRESITQMVQSTLAAAQQIWQDTFKQRADGFSRQLEAERAIGMLTLRRAFHFQKLSGWNYDYTLSLLADKVDESVCILRDDLSLEFCLASLCAVASSKPLDFSSRGTVELLDLFHALDPPSCPSPAELQRNMTSAADEFWAPMCSECGFAFAITSLEAAADVQVLFRRNWAAELEVKSLCDFMVDPPCARKGEGIFCPRCAPRVATRRLD